MSYLQWLASQSPTEWWNDSGDPTEIERALSQGAVGVTTNPPLCAQAIRANRERWRDEIEEAIRTAAEPRRKAEALTRIVVTDACRRLADLHQRTGGRSGWVCAQVDPTLAGERRPMDEMARRTRSWAPNVAIKLPATSAGLDVMEGLVSEGATVTMTVSFTVAQVLAAAERYQRASARAGSGAAGRCFAVVMIGRLDDYLREVFADEGDGSVDAGMAGLCVVKRAHRMLREGGSGVTLLVAALRGQQHVTQIIGGDLVLSVHPSWQAGLLQADPPREPRISVPVPEETEHMLLSKPEFRRAYDPKGLSESQMITFGLTQRTLSQFVEAGWRQLELFEPIAAVATPHALDFRAKSA